MLCFPLCLLHKRRPASELAASRNAAEYPPQCPQDSRLVYRFSRPGRGYFPNQGAFVFQHGHVGHVRSSQRALHNERELLEFPEGAAFSADFRRSGRRDFQRRRRFVAEPEETCSAADRSPAVPPVSGEEQQEQSGERACPYS